MVVSAVPGVLCVSGDGFCVVLLLQVTGSVIGTRNLVRSSYHECVVPKNVCMEYF